MPWLITLSGVLLTGLTHGVNGAAAWAVPLVLVVGLLVGVFNGVGVVMLGLPPIVVTLAANGLLQGLTLIYCNGSPQGWSPSAISEFTNGRFGPLSLAAWSVPVFLASRWCCCIARRSGGACMRSAIRRSRRSSRACAWARR